MPVKIDYTGFKQRSFELNFDYADSLVPFGTLTLQVPERLDTFYKWNNTTCCSACGFYQYRIADSRYNQFAESGFFWTYKADSAYQLTFIHRPTKEWEDSVRVSGFTLKDSGYYSGFKFNPSGSAPLKFFRKGFEIINGRTYFFSAFVTRHGEMTQDTTLYVTAVTRLKKTVLSFVAECGAKDTANFVSSMYKSLLSINISEK